VTHLPRVFIEAQKATFQKTEFSLLIFITLVFRSTGLNLDEQIEAALRDGLSEDRSGIDSNPVYRKPNEKTSQLRYDAMWDFWEVYVANIIPSCGKNSCTFRICTPLKPI